MGTAQICGYSVKYKVFKSNTKIFQFIFFKYIYILYAMISEDNLYEILVKNIV